MKKNIAWSCAVALAAIGGWLASETLHAAASGTEPRFAQLTV